jgi:hypothetical protein
MILKSRMVQTTICDYWVLNWQLTGPRNLVQAVTRLTIRNVPDSNLGPVIVNRNAVPRPRRLVGEVRVQPHSFLSFAQDWSTLRPGRLTLQTTLTSSFLVLFRHQTNVSILCIQQPFPFRSLNSSIGIQTTLWNWWSRVWVPAGARRLSLIQNIQTDSGAHPAVSPGVKVATACGWPLNVV